MSVYKALSDSELITLLRGGDEYAYTEIYHRYHYLMLVFAYKKLRDEDLAKDFVQELFTNLWYKRETLSDVGNFAAFLYITLRRKILDHFVHQKVESKYISFLKHYVPEAGTEKADHLIRNKELSHYIEKQIEALPRKMRAVFELSRKEHLTHKEIANKLDTSEHNVAKQITNALKILKTKVGSALFNFFI
jgi:RNA polymerase sigma-70 factor (family 1)